MRCGSRSMVAAGAFVLLAAAAPRTGALAPVHQQLYCMGTMFDIVAYHGSRAQAERAVTKAMEEIARLDGVLSHYKPDSDLSKLVRGRRGQFVAVDPSLYEVIRESLVFSRRSGGKFDVTIGPLVRTWKAAGAEGRRPSAAEIAAARRCVGYEQIEVSAPDRIRFSSDCLEVDLGGIGKGYAVDRAIAVLKAEGIRDAVVNAGSSSIASLGAPPGRDGWPISLNAPVSGRQILLLRDRSISTSQQGPLEEIIDPGSAAPAESRLSVSVVAPTATLSDALDTTLLMLSMDEGTKLLEQFPGVSALWISATGELRASYATSQLALSDAR